MRQSVSSASTQIMPSWGKVLCTLEGRVPIQRELHRLDKWKYYFKQCSNGRQGVLPQEGITPCSNAGWELTGGKMAWQKRDLLELMENMLNTAQQCGLETWKTNNIHGCISNNIISLKNIGILSLFSELVRLCLE